MVLEHGGADVNALDGHGESALHVVARMCNHKPGWGAGIGAVPGYALKVANLDGDRRSVAKRGGAGVGLGWRRAL